MKLGIIVAYLVNSSNEKLMHIHLERIGMHTSCPYVIYGLINPNRILSVIKKKLENVPYMHVVERNKPNLSMFGANAALPVIEHAYYLDELAKIAVKDDCTHVATFHVDSFPIANDWDVKLSNELNDQCVLAAIQRKEDSDRKPHPCGMIFTSKFYKKYHPSFRLQAAEYSSPDFKKYVKENNNLIVKDSGVGYGFCTWENQLTWKPLLRNNVNEHHNIFGGIYDDCFFHVGGAIRNIKKLEYQKASTKVLKHLHKDHVKYINWLKGI
jgi:hypothetical protein